MSRVAIILTCFNRREKTVNCIKKLAFSNNENDMYFFVVDDRSSDGTVEAIEKLNVPNMNIIHGTGSLFWNGGMHLGIDNAFKYPIEFDYALLVNDDVDFYPEVIDRLVAHANASDFSVPVVYVGATRGDDGKFSYGGIRYTSGIKYVSVTPDEPDTDCSTFNANCTLIPYTLLKKVGNIDPYYKHSMGDFDLGFRVGRAGAKIRVYGEYVGVCNDNPTAGTWQDNTLPVMERIKKKESFKGLPFKDWFHYLNKNFGFACAVIRSFTPYIKILLHK